MAARQHDVISREQLVELGYSAEAIRHRVATGRLHVLWRGIYAVGRPQVTQHGRWMGAVLRCGEGAALSHRSAGALLGICPEPPGPIHVSVRRGKPQHRGIAVHRRAEFAVTRRHSIPVTTVVCTLIDLATIFDRDDLEAAINEADRRGLVDPERLRRALDVVPRRPGMGVLRETLDYRTFTMTDSWLERAFLPIARRAGLPKPLTQEWVNGFRVDFYWPDLGLVVETDGLTYHRTPAQQAADALRNQIHAASELVPLRFTRAQVRYEPAHVEAVLTRVARRLSVPR